MRAANMPFFLMTVLALFWPCLAGATELFDEPCARFGVPKSLVLAIAKQESDMQPFMINVAGKDYRAKTREQALAIVQAAQTQGLNFDVGIMQINRYWLRKLNITPEVAIEPANNITLGCWILASMIRKHGYNWRAVGFYHSPTPWRQEDYAMRVSRHYQKLKGTIQ